MKKLRQKKIEFVLNEFLDVSRVRDASTNRYIPKGIETAPGGDDALERTVRFIEQFPSRSKDPSVTGAFGRFRRLLNQLVDCGAVDRHRVGVYKNYVGDSGGWVYMYYLNESTLNDLKYGHRTVEEVSKEISDII